MMNKKSLPRAATQTADIRNQSQITPDSKICQETRFESFLQIEPNKRCALILEAMGNEEMTARQIAYKLRFSDLNAVRPRLSEMLRDGRVEAVGKAFDDISKRNVTVFRRAVQ